MQCKTKKEIRPVCIKNFNNTALESFGLRHVKHKVLSLIVTARRIEDK